MASTLKDLLQRFTFWVAGIALVAVLVVASLAGRAATRTLERLADQRGAEVAARATALVANYVRERHAEADQLAANPSLIRAAMEAARSVVDRHLDALAPADLERMFAAKPATVKIKTRALKKLKQAVSTVRAEDYSA